MCVLRNCGLHVVVGMGGFCARFFFFMGEWVEENRGVVRLVRKQVKRDRSGKKRKRKKKMSGKKADMDLEFQGRVLDATSRSALGHKICGSVLWPPLSNLHWPSIPNSPEFGSAAFLRRKGEISLETYV